MPTLFIGHGSPMNTLEHNDYTNAWRHIGRMLPRPRAILSVSAHWFVPVTAVTAMARPRTIHDFHGFPAALSAFHYPAPGLPGLVEEIAQIVRPHRVESDDRWGLDHGTWSVLAHLFPQADVPVVQLSINAQESLEYHLDLGARLAPLRDAGVLILASGNVVHNLRRIRWDAPNAGEAWAQRFDDAMKALMTDAPGDMLKAVDHADYGMAVPTPDHFIPLLYTAGLAATSQERATAFIRGYAFGSLSMTCYSIGMDALLLQDRAAG